MPNSKEQASWNENLVEVFVDLCIKEVHKNSKSGSHFSSNGWKTIVKCFVEQTGKDYTRKQLKNKWDSLKGDWKLWKTLKSVKTGLGWNPILNTIDADEEFWREQIGEYARFRKKGISPEFEAKLDQLFLGTTATGKHAWAPSSTLLIPDSPEEGDNDIHCEGSGDSDERDVSTNTLPKRRRSDRAMKDKGKLPAKKDKVGGAAQLAKEIGRMCSAIESRSTASSAVHNARTNIVEVMKDVTALPGAEQGTSLWFFATRLFLSPEKREMYCTMDDPSMKLEWLKFEMTEK
ncbi:L10-interacting MYB domain-containing protein-like [Argentina anserina]|uniref:L10-interacting MYB domain-containing protein-like n=1 Tax=Argentina anserina TaxID=57926 RepID=UPI00217632EF|nr:L10-interacting MYB domain-containing protein-like [Potentilla anserina]